MHLVEPVDFVHIYETSNYDSSQVIDMFGDIAGVCKLLHESNACR